MRVRSSDKARDFEPAAQQDGRKKLQTDGTGCGTTDVCWCHCRRCAASNYGARLRTWESRATTSGFPDVQEHIRVRADARPGM